MAQTRWQWLRFVGKGQQVQEPRLATRDLTLGHRDLHLDQTAMCPLYPFNPFLVSDLDRPFGHPGYMVDSSVTPTDGMGGRDPAATAAGCGRRRRVALPTPQSV